MKPSDILKQAQLTIRKGFCKGWLAHDKNGNRCYYDDETRAVSWCAIGAITLAALGTNSLAKETISYCHDAVGAPRGRAGREALIAYNDSFWTTRWRVIRMMKRAQKIAESEGR